MEKNLNENPAFQELPDESLNAVAGGYDDYNGVRYWYRNGTKVRFTPTEGSSEYLYGGIVFRRPGIFHGAKMAHYDIEVRQDTGCTTYKNIPEYYVRRVE